MFHLQAILLQLSGGLPAVTNFIVTAVAILFFPIFQRTFDYPSYPITYVTTH
jgi:hypothetical protein